MYLIVLVALGPISFASGAAPNKIVYLCDARCPETLIIQTAAVAAGDPEGIILLDTPAARAGNARFLREYNAERVVRFGQQENVWNLVSGRPAAVVLCPPSPRSRVLQAACLAGVVKGPLLLTDGSAGDTEQIRRRIARWQPATVFVTGDAWPRGQRLPGAGKIIRVTEEGQVAAAHCRRLAESGPVRTLVLANPADSQEGVAMSCLAPYLAVRKHAALVLCSSEKGDATKQVEQALSNKQLRDADTLLIAADLKAIPTERRPNPIPKDKDREIEMEPMTPFGTAPFSFSIGRLFHQDPGIVALMLARQKLLTTGARRTALVASNPGGSLPLLETFSRTTTRELQNAGYQTTGLFGPQVTRRSLREQFCKHDIVLWEGHHNTLFKEWGFLAWDEPLPPAFIFMQSCLALAEGKIQPLFERGAIGVIGTSTRTYSASGGAISLGFFNALLHEGRPPGEALRQAKNFLIAYSMLKEKRLGNKASRTGANFRAAWAFSLWGDPTFKLPTPQVEKILPPLRHTVRSDVITLRLPGSKHEKVTTSRYEAEIHPNVRLAGLIRKCDPEDFAPLVPLLFAEIHLPRAGTRTPQLSSRLPESNWVFNWDARRKTGYLLVIPRAKDRSRIQFTIRWSTGELARVSEPLPTPLPETERGAKPIGK